jgi:hypothetical protein
MTAPNLNDSCRVVRALIAGLFFFASPCTLAQSAKAVTKSPVAPSAIVHSMKLVRVEFSELAEDVPKKITYRGRPVFVLLAGF